MGVEWGGDLKPWRSHPICTWFGRHSWRSVWTRKGRKGEQCRRCHLCRWPT